MQKTLKSNFKLFLYLLFIIFLLISGGYIHKWLYPCSTITTNKYIKIRDTKIVTKTKVDTVYRWTKLNTTSGISITTDLDSNIRETKTNIETNDLKGTILTIHTGKILNSSLTYQVQYPEINKIDSIFIYKTDSIYTEKILLKDNNKFKFLVGGEVSNLLNPGVSVGVQLKNNMHFYYTYKHNFNLNNTIQEHVIGIKFPLYLKK